MKDVLNSATTMPGALSVMISGAHLMLMLYVDNLATRIKVRICKDDTSISLTTNNNLPQVLLLEAQLSSAKDLDPSYWTMLGAQELSRE